MFKRNLQPAIGMPLNAAPVTIPLNALGLNANYWPLFNANLPTNDPCYPLTDPGFPYQLVRTLTVSLGRLSWYSVEQTADTYTWTDFDAFFGSPQMVGKKAIFCPFSTPTPWITSGAPNHYELIYGVYGNASTRLGASGPPSNAQKTKNFVNAYLNRYGAQTYGIEVDNEPTFGTSLANNNFSICTYQEMIDKKHVPVYDQVQTWNTANGGSVKVLSPAFYGNGSPVLMNTYLATVETGGSGRRAIDMCDMLSIHLYNIRNPPAKRDLFNDGGTGLLTQVAATQAALGTNKPLGISELGYASGAADPALVTWLARGLGEPALWYKRNAGLALIMGVQFVCDYAFDSTLAGNQIKDASLIQAKNDLANALLGKTVAAGATLNASTGALSFVANGVPYSW